MSRAVRLGAWSFSLLRHQLSEQGPSRSVAVERLSDTVEEVHAKAAAELKKATDPAAANEVRVKAETQVIQAIERSGMRLHEFNQIVELRAVDPGLRARVASRVEQRRRI